MVNTNALVEGKRIEITNPNSKTKTRGTIIARGEKSITVLTEKKKGKIMYSFGYLNRCLVRIH